MHADSTLESARIPLFRLISAHRRYAHARTYEQVNETVVDQRDFDFLSRYQWHEAASKWGVYARRGTGTSRSDIGWSMVHSEVWERHNGPVPYGKTVDHKSRDRLDNRLENLRLATVSQQGYNKGVPANSATGYRGVHFWQHGQVYKAAIRVTANGVRRRIHLGRSLSAEEMALSCNHAAHLLHGEFAWLNQIPEGAIPIERVLQIMKEAEMKCRPYMEPIAA